MRCLVTGGAGFIGSNIIKLLLERGHQVTVLDDLSTGYRGNLDPFPAVRFVQGDIRDCAILSEVMAGQEAVLHLAASVGNKKSIEHPQEDAGINVIGTLNVLEAMRAHDVPAIVFSSSAGIFGEPQYQPIDEDHPCEPDSPYGATKLCAEKQILAYSRLYGLRGVALRYFNVYGVNQRFDAYGNVIPIFVTRLLRGEPLTIYGDGEQTRDFVNVKDVAAANVAAAENPAAQGKFNVGCGASITINDLVAALRDAGGREVEVVHGPERPGDVRHSLAKIDRLREVLGIQPRQDIAAELAEYIPWLAADDGGRR